MENRGGRAFCRIIGVRRIGGIAFGFPWRRVSQARSVISDGAAAACRWAHVWRNEPRAITRSLSPGVFTSPLLPLSPPLPPWRLCPGAAESVLRWQGDSAGGPGETSSPRRRKPISSSRYWKICPFTLRRADGGRTVGRRSCFGGTFHHGGRSVSIPAQRAPSPPVCARTDPPPRPSPSLKATLITGSSQSNVLTYNHPDLRAAILF